MCPLTERSGERVCIFRRFAFQQQNTPCTCWCGAESCRDRARGGRLSGILDEFGSEDEEDRGRRRAQLGLREAAGGVGDGAGDDDDDDDDQGEVRRLMLLLLLLLRSLLCDD